MIEEIAGLYARHGANPYAEAVSQTAHACQCAWLAERDGADAPLIAAALLHDIGHFLHKRGADPAARGIDDKHEAIGAAWLARGFGEAVCAPVRLHVAAKRYLCTKEPAYLKRLSPASQRSLMLQGGPFAPNAATAFAAHAHAEAAVRLRRWDDGAKRADIEAPEIAVYLARLQDLLA